MRWKIYFSYFSWALPIPSLSSLSSSLLATCRSTFKNLERYLQWILCYLLLVLYDSKAIHMRRWTSAHRERENFRECEMVGEGGKMGKRVEREMMKKFFESSQRTTLRCVKIVLAMYTKSATQFFSLAFSPIFRSTLIVTSTSSMAAAHNFFLLLARQRWKNNRRNSKVCAERN